MRTLQMRMLLFTVFALVVCGTAAFADTITFTQTAIGTGTLGGTSFSNVIFTITARGDTANRQNPMSGIYYIDNLSASITLSGLGSYNFLNPTLFFVNNLSGYIGFSQAGVSDLLDGPFDPSFLTWGMRSSTGPIAGDGYLLQWSLMPVLTNGGQLIFDEGLTPTTFQATVDPVPEPPAAVMLGIGVLMFATVLISKQPR